MSISQIFQIRKGCSPEDLFEQDPKFWLVPSRIHPTEELGLCQGREYVRSGIAKGQWRMVEDSRRIPKQILASRIGVYTNFALDLWPTTKIQAVSRSGGDRFLKLLLSLFRSALTPLPPSPNLSIDPILRSQKAKLASMAAQHSVDLSSISMKRGVAFNEARSLGIAVGSVAWKSLQTRWDELKKAKEEQHKLEKIAIGHSHQMERNMIQPQWICGLEQRKKLLKAHLVVFDALILIEEPEWSEIIKELVLDPLDCDESLLRAFHRRMDVIRKLLYE